MLQCFKTIIYIFCRQAICTVLLHKNQSVTFKHVSIEITLNYLIHQQM